MYSPFLLAFWGSSRLSSRQRLSTPPPVHPPPGCCRPGCCRPGCCRPRPSLVGRHPAGSSRVLTLRCASVSAQSVVRLAVNGLPGLARGADGLDDGRVGSARLGSANRRAGGHRVAGAGSPFPRHLPGELGLEAGFVRCRQRLGELPVRGLLPQFGLSPGPCKKQGPATAVAGPCRTMELSARSPGRHRPDRRPAGAPPRACAEGRTPRRLSPRPGQTPPSRCARKRSRPGPDPP